MAKNPYLAYLTGAGGSNSILSILHVNLKDVIVKGLEISEFAVISISGW